MKVKEENEKLCLNSTFKNKDHGTQVDHFTQIYEEKWKQWQSLFSWAPKWPWMMTAATKLKDACSVEENLWQTETVY